MLLAAPSVAFHAYYLVFQTYVYVVLVFVCFCIVCGVRGSNKKSQTCVACASPLNTNTLHRLKLDVLLNAAALAFCGVQVSRC